MNPRREGRLGLCLPFSKDGSGRQSGDTATCFRGPRGLQGGPPARSHAPPRLPERRPLELVDPGAAVHLNHRTRACGRIQRFPAPPL